MNDKKYACPVCEKEIDREPELIEAWKVFKIYKCPFCDVYFSDPIARAAECALDPYVELDWNHRQFLEDPPLKSGTLLDIGCGSGYFLSLAAGLGFDCSGIDINSTGVKMAKERFGLKQVYCCTLDEFAEKNPGKFDVVTLFESLEHLDYPARIMRKVHALLKDGGVLVLSTPNRDRFCTPFRKEVDYPPNHQTRWSAKVLKGFLERSGFEPVALKVKPLDKDELSRTSIEEYGLKISSTLQKAGEQKRNSALVFVGQLLSRIKRISVPVVFFPITLVLRLFGAQGWDLYCVARKKG